MDAAILHTADVLAIIVTSLGSGTQMGMCTLDRAEKLATVAGPTSILAVALRRGLDLHRFVAGFGAHFEISPSFGFWLFGCATSDVESPQSKHASWMDDGRGSPA